MEPTKVKIKKRSSKSKAGAKASNFEGNALLIIGVIAVAAILVFILFVSSLNEFKRQLDGTSTSNNIVLP